MKNIFTNNGHGIKGEKVIEKLLFDHSYHLRMLQNKQIITFRMRDNADVL